MLLFVLLKKSLPNPGFFLEVLWASLVAQTVKNLSAMQEIQVWSLDREDLLETGMAISSFSSFIFISDWFWTLVLEESQCELFK